MTLQSGKNILVLVRDLAFRERIRAQGDNMRLLDPSINLVFARSIAQAQERVHACGDGFSVHRTLIDLNGFDLPPTEIASQVRAIAPHTALVGFCSHVDRERIQEALESGFSQVLPRSTFFASLAELLCP